MGWGCFFAAVSGAALFCSTRSGVGLFYRFQLKLQQFCVKPFVGHANLIRCRYWRLEERRDGAVSRVVSVFFCAVYIVLLGQCYVAMPSGYKLVITRALGLHGIYCTQPSGLAPSCFSAIYSIHPSCPCYNYNIKYAQRFFFPLLNLLWLHPCSSVCSYCELLQQLAVRL